MGRPGNEAKDSSQLSLQKTGGEESLVYNCEKSDQLETGYHSCDQGMTPTLVTIAVFS